MKLKLALIYGSRSCEHDVSVISALQAAKHVNPDEYELIYVYIAQNGDWYTGWRLGDISLYRNFDPKVATRVIPMGENGKLVLMQHPSDRLLPIGHLKRVAEADVALTVLHGMHGEDGTLQGMLEMWGVPYTSSGVLGSAVGMDKIAMKQVFRSSGLNVLPDVIVNRSELKQNKKAVLARISAALKYPVYVKPANLGSSIGISKASDEKELSEALEVAASYDRRILVEQGIEKLMEINCSVLGFDGEAEASVTEMPVKWTEFLSFEEKYLRGGKGAKGGKLGGAKTASAKGGMASLKRQMPAPIGEEMTRKVESAAIQAFNALDCKGVARVDFLLDEDTNELYVGEINTIPGSLSYYLWEEKGLPFTKLIDKLVEYAFKASAETNQNVFSYKSAILSGSAGTKGTKR
ncbi:MAG: D-alanine--D-alanine ligase [Clostridia bacterium]|nr:D-alanine--D-alanine ligase [Clostridia bacterium]